jgi:hypothetical protein
MGEGSDTADGNRLTNPNRHDRAWPGHPRLCQMDARK